MSDHLTIGDSVYVQMFDWLVAAGAGLVGAVAGALGVSRSSRKREGLVILRITKLEADFSAQTAASERRAEKMEGSIAKLTDRSASLGDTVAELKATMVTRADVAALGMVIEVSFEKLSERIESRLDALALAVPGKANGEAG